MKTILLPQNFLLYDTLVYILACLNSPAGLYAEILQRGGGANLMYFKSSCKQCQGGTGSNLKGGRD